MPMTIQDAIAAAVDSRPGEFLDAFETVLQDKLSNAVETMKLDVAQSMFARDDAVDEVSSKLLTRYVNKAKKDKEGLKDERRFYQAHGDNTDTEDRKIANRTKGIDLANRKARAGNFRVKVPGKARVKEDVEQVDERSKATTDFWSKRLDRTGKRPGELVDEPKKKAGKATVREDVEQVAVDEARGGPNRGPRLRRGGPNSKKKADKPDEKKPTAKKKDCK